MQIPGTLSGSPASSLAVPGRQCIRYDVVKKCVCNFSDMQRLQERPARRWESCRPVFPTALRAHAQEGFRHSDAPEGISGTHNQEQWLDHLLQAVEMLLVVLLAAGQFPAARTVWQDLRKSTHSADKETATAKGRLQLVLDHHYPVQQASIVQVGSILGLAGVLLINWILRRRISCRQQRTAMAAAGPSAGARLLRLELLATRQSQALIAAERQITKLNTRARLLGRDLQPPLRQVQAENMQQAEALARISNKLESLDTDLRDTQQLLGALHGATAKQLQLVMQALQLSQAAKALAQSVAAAVEKDREAGMGLPGQATQSRRSSTAPEASSHEGVWRPPESGLAANGGSIQPSRSKESTELSNGSKSQQSRCSDEQSSRFASPVLHESIPRMPTLMRDSNSSDQQYSAIESAIREDSQGAAASSAWSLQTHADGDLGDLHENYRPEIEIPKMQLDMQTPCCSKGSEYRHYCGEVIGEYVLYRFG